MTAIGALPVRANEAAKAAGSCAPRVEKSADNAESNGEHRGNTQPRERRGPSADRRALSRPGTEASAPLWYGPRLRAPFVAQLIGQVLAAGDAPRPMVYREKPVPVGLMLDRRA
jgi:hypothetical protein